MAVHGGRARENTDDKWIQITSILSTVRHIQDSVISSITGTSRICRIIYGLTLWDWLTGSVEIMKESYKKPKLDALLELKNYLGRHYIHADEFTTEDCEKMITEIELKTREKPVYNRRDEELLKSLLKEIIKTNKTKNRIIGITNQSASAEDPEDMKLLNELWINLTTSEEIPLVSPKSAGDSNRNSWQFIGFQSNDPFRDFRAVGKLGLIMLHKWSSEHTRRARDVLNESRDESSYYSFASVSLNVVSWTLEHLQAGELDAFFFLNNRDPLDTLGTIFSYTVLEFHRLWRLTRPRSMLQFGDVRKKFRQQLTQLFSSFNGVNPHIGGYLFNTAGPSALCVGGILSGEDLESELISWIEGRAIGTQSNKLAISTR